MTDETTIRDRIRKLLNMTTESGCTEDEADTAMRMATSLMARHGIALDGLNVDEETTARIGRHIQKRFQRYQQTLASAAAYLYGCKILTYDNGKGGLEFVGRDDNRSVAEDTFFWLIRQVDFFYKDALPSGLSKRERAKYRRSFKDAAAIRVFQRAVRLVKEMESNENVAQKATGSTALVVKGHFDRLRAEADEAMKEKYGESLKKPRKSRRIKSGPGTREGLRAGDRVQLKKQGDLNDTNTRGQIG